LVDDDAQLSSCRRCSNCRHPHSSPPSVAFSRPVPTVLYHHDHINISIPLPCDRALVRRLLAPVRISRSTRTGHHHHLLLHPLQLQSARCTPPKTPTTRPSTIGPTRARSSPLPPPLPSPPNPIRRGRSLPSQPTKPSLLSRRHQVTKFCHIHTKSTSAAPSTARMHTHAR